MKTFIINDQKVVIADDIDTKTISAEGHMRVFARLASIKNMHGTPGVRRGKS